MYDHASLSDIEEGINEDNYKKTMGDRLLTVITAYCFTVIFCAGELVIVVSILVVASFLALQLVQISQ